MLESLLITLHRYRRVTLLVGLAAAICASCLLWRLSVNDSSERWYPAHCIEAWNRFAEHYEFGDTVAVAMDFHRPIRDDDMDLLKAMRGDLEKVPGISRVIDLSRIAEKIERTSLTGLLGDSQRNDLYRGVLFDDLAGSAAAGGRPEGSPESQESTPPPGGTLVTVLELEAAAEGGDEVKENERLRRRELVAGVYRILEKHGRDDVTYHLVGGIVVEYELELIARRLLRIHLPLSLLLVLLVLGIGCRSLSAMIIAAAGGIWSVILMLGGVVLAGGTLNVLTVASPLLMAVIVVATTVHVSHHLSSSRAAAAAGEGEARSGKPVRVARFIQWVAVPCLGASIITGVGFLMLAFNELRPTRELGIELFFGSILAFLGVYLAWIAVQPTPVKRKWFLSVERLRRVHGAVVARPRATIALLGILTALLMVGAVRVKVDADPFSFFQPESRVARALSHLEKRGFGYYILEVLLVPRHQPGNPDPALARLEDFRVAREFEDRIKRRPEIRKTISALSLLSRQRILNLDLADLRRALEFQDTFKNWTVDRAGQGAIRITFLVCDAGSGFRPLMNEVRNALPRDRFECYYTGSAAHVVVLFENLMGGLIRGLGAALVIMPVLCLLFFRSLRLTLLAFLPNAFPILVIFGVMGTFGIPLNSGSAMVSTVALGIGLVDTIHFVMYYRRRRLEGDNARDAVANTFAGVSRPMILTSLTTCLGFGIFLLSDFRPLYDFGLLASTAMIVALVGDLVLLPNLLKLLDGNHGDDTGNRAMPAHGKSLPEADLVELSRPVETESCAANTEPSNTGARRR